jgi:ubiquinone/menaquinone biosynthesis C-methylase UbiE
MKNESDNQQRKDHWEKVYSEKQPTEVSWYQQHPEYSLELIDSTGIDPSASIIDIGGGASTLVDNLLKAGYENLSVLDISSAAIKQAKGRLVENEMAKKVKWIELDITKFKTDERFDVWHDRAVFHFLIDEKDRLSYVNVMSRVLEIGSTAIIAAFDFNGPKQCSGLDVVHYNPEKMSAVLGPSFQLIETRSEEHVTPSDSLQSFIYCRFIRV